MMSQFLLHGKRLFSSSWASRKCENPRTLQSRSGNQAETNHWGALNLDCDHKTEVEEAELDQG